MEDTYADTAYADTRRATPQAQAFAHEGEHDTSITVMVGDTPVAVISDGDYITWTRPETAGHQRTADTELLRAAREFAEAAATLSLRAMEAGIENAYGVPVGD